MTEKKRNNDIKQFFIVDIAALMDSLVVLTVAT